MRREAVHLVRQAVSEDRHAPMCLTKGVDPEDVGMMDWSGSDDLKGITGVSGNQFTAGSTVIVVREIVVVVVFQFQVQVLTGLIRFLCPLHA